MQAQTIFQAAEEVVVGLKIRIQIFNQLFGDQTAVSVDVFFCESIQDTIDYAIAINSIMRICLLYTSPSPRD